MAEPQDDLNADTTQRQTQVTEPQHAQQAKAVDEYAQPELFGEKAEAAQLAQHAKHKSAELIRAHHSISREVCFFSSLLLVLLCSVYACSVHHKLESPKVPKCLLIHRTLGAVWTCQEQGWWPMLWTAAQSLQAVCQSQVTARSAVATSSCAFMSINFVPLLDAPICCTPQLQAAL